MSEAIGIVGGLGPFAGLDLNRKIFESVRAEKDQQYPDVCLISASRSIGDRTEYLLNPAGKTNPAGSIAKVIQKLALIGAVAIGVPCNTAHAPPIWQELTKELSDLLATKIKLLHMIAETKTYIQASYPNAKAGLLATRGSYQTKVYEQVFSEPRALEILVPSLEEQEIVNNAIYNTEYGVKGAPPTQWARAAKDFAVIARNLMAEGADIIIMGCTEIPLALTDASLPLIDPTLILARALLREICPEKLKSEVLKQV